MLNQKFLNYYVYSICLLAFIALIGGTTAYAAPLSTPTENEQQELMLVDKFSDRFGYSVAIDGDTAVIGAPLDKQMAGFAYIFNRDDAGIWHESAILRGSDVYRKKRSFFGHSVDISGDTVVVGAPGFGLENFYTPRPFGAAYVFKRNARGEWHEQAKLYDVDAVNPANFGASVAIDGETILIGQPSYDFRSFHWNDQGAAFIYTRDANDEWIKQVRLSDPNGKEDNLYGQVIALKGDMAIICAIKVGSQQRGFVGAAFVYNRDEYGDWNNQARLSAADGFDGDGFCSSVATDGDTIVIGANKSLVNQIDTGAAYIFNRNGAGVWQEQVKITSSDGSSQDSFGDSVQVSGEIVLVSGRFKFETMANNGAAYVFRRDDSDQWQETVKWRSLNQSIRFFGSLGHGIDISGNTAIVGTGVGSSAFIFPLD